MAPQYGNSSLLGQQAGRHGLPNDSLVSSKSMARRKFFQAHMSQSYDALTYIHSFLCRVLPLPRDYGFASLCLGVMSCEAPGLSLGLRLSLRRNLALAPSEPLILLLFARIDALEVSCAYAEHEHLSNGQGSTMDRECQNWYSCRERVTARNSLQRQSISTYRSAHSRGKKNECAVGPDCRGRSSSMRAFPSGRGSRTITLQAVLCVAHEVNLCTTHRVYLCAPHCGRLFAFASMSKTERGQGHTCALGTCTLLHLSRDTTFSERTTNVPIIQIAMQSKSSFNMNQQSLEYISCIYFHDALINLPTVLKALYLTSGSEWLISLITWILPVENRLPASA